MLLMVERGAGKGRERVGTAKTGKMPSAAVQTYTRRYS